MISTLGLITALFTKHLVVDFFMQPPYMYKNKGTYGHIGGVSPAATHGWATLCIFYCWPGLLPWTGMLAIAEFFIHYHIDWAKMNINKRCGWTPVNSEYFWMLLGVDQFLHALTYIWMVWMIVG